MVDPLKIQFLFDFGSPNAYLSAQVIRGIEQRTNVNFEYVPVLLGGIFKATGNKSPFETLRGIRNKPQYAVVEFHRFLRRHSITTFKSNPFFPLNTLMLMRGAVAAQFEDMSDSYFKAAFHHMWEAPKKMDDPEIYRSAFLASGIDIERIIARSQRADVKQRLVENTDYAVSRGAFGVPTFFVGEEMFFGKDQLRDVEESIIEQRNSAM